MVNLKIPPDAAVSQIIERINEIKTVQENQDGSVYYNFVGWCSKTWSVVDGIFGDELHSEEIRMIGVPGCSCSAQAGTGLLADLYYDKLMDYIREIRQSAESAK